MRKKFSNFGKIEKIEIFTEGSIKFAHITFKESFDAYLALLYFEKNHLNERFTVQLATYHEQLSTTILDIPDECLNEIFKNCNIHAQSMIVSTCIRFRKVIEKVLLGKSKIIEYEGHCAPKGITSACRLIKYIDSNGCKLTFESSCLYPGVILYIITINFNYSCYILDIDTSSLKTYSLQFQEISNYFKVLRVRLESVESIPDNEIAFDKVQILLFVYTKSPYSLPTNIMKVLPKLATIGFHGVGFPAKTFSDYLDVSSKLQKIIISTCNFQNPQDIFSGLMQNESNETHSLEIIYNNITFRKNATEDVDSVK